MPAVFHNEHDILEVREDWLTRLKQEAELNPRRRARLCLHRGSTDSVQEMLIVFCRDALVPVHRSVNKSESFHVVEGELRVIMFDGAGNITQRFEMGPVGSGKVFMSRFSSSPWYTYVPLTEYVAIHEITRGPFDSSETDFPTWAPSEETELRSFLERISDAETAIIS